MNDKYVQHVCTKQQLVKRCSLNNSGQRIYQTFSGCHRRHDSFTKCHLSLSNALESHLSLMISIYTCNFIVHWARKASLLTLIFTFFVRSCDYDYLTESFWVWRGYSGASKKLKFAYVSHHEKGLISKSRNFIL